MTQMIDTESVANYIRETANALILPRFRALSAADVREKKPGDPVTIADTEAEQRADAPARQVIPGANVLGEESVAEDPSRLAWLSAEAPVWIIDPIDGTANFVRGHARLRRHRRSGAAGRGRGGLDLQPARRRHDHARSRARAPGAAGGGCRSSAMCRRKSSPARLWPHQIGRARRPRAQRQRPHPRRPQSGLQRA